MTDTRLTDMGPFFERYDRRVRLLMVTATVTTLALSGAIAVHLIANGETGAKRTAITWAMGVAYPSLVNVGWWIFTELMARSRRRTSLPDGRYPAGSDDARNGMRIANAGFIFTIGLTAAVFVQQALVALSAFGYPFDHPAGGLVARATCVVVGAVTIYLGNLWPRMPTPRAPTDKAAVTMRLNRISGWVMVIIGVLVLLLGLFMPHLLPGTAIWPAHG